MKNLFGNGGDSDEVQFISQRMRMVDEQLIKRGIRDSLVLSAMRTVARHKFLSGEKLKNAYSDCALSIDESQTISQPFVVADMTEQLNIDRESKVLEIGTGSGYQTAILAEIAFAVYTIELIPSLYSKSGSLLDQLGYDNIHRMLGDGLTGWNSKAPFDAIIVTAAAPKVPELLLEQLKIEGIMVIPVGKSSDDTQQLVKLTKKIDTVIKEILYPVRFVPMKGKIEK